MEENNKVGLNCNKIYLIDCFSAFGKYSDPLTFYTFHFLRYSLILKWITYNIFLINLHTISYNDKAKTV